LAYVHFVRQPSPKRYALTLLLFALGLMAKPMLVTLPFVLLLLDFWPLQRCLAESRDRSSEAASLSLPASSGPGVSALVLEKVPFLILSAASSVVTYIAQSKGGAVSSFEVIPIQTRLANALVSYWHYVEKTFWPQGLSVFYPHPGNHLPLWEIAFAAMLLVGVSFLVLFQAARRPFLATGWFWFMGMLVPVLGILQVGGQSMADRYTYLPCIGLFIMIAWFLPSLPGRLFHHKILLFCGFTVIVVSLGYVTWVQTGYWKDTETLFDHAAAVTEKNYLAHFLMGDSLAAQNKPEMALIEYEKAIAIVPEYAEAHNKIGMLLAKQGCINEAMDHYQEALRANPKNALTHLNVASVLVDQGNLDEAMTHYLAALSTAPDSGAVFNGLGVVMARMQRLDEALSYLFKAVEICPDCPEGHNNLGRVLTFEGNFEEAFKHLFRAVELRPTYAEAHNNLALAYLQIGDLEEALYHAAAALHFRSDYEKARANLQVIVRRLEHEETRKSSP
jgi:protein O-mannosyl-transferase